MSNTINLKALFLLILCAPFILNSCSPDDSISDRQSSAQGSWQLGDFSYENALIERETDEEGLVTVVAVNDNNDNDGDFSGSAIIVTFNDLESGDYTIVQSGQVEENRNERVLNVACIIGTATDAGTRYDVIDSTEGTANLFKEENGTYTITISQAITLEKSVEVGGGVPNAEEQYNFTMDGVN